MEGGALRRRRTLRAALSGRNRRIFRQLKLDSDRSSSFSPCARTGEDRCSRRRSSGTDHQSMARGKFLAGWSLRHHAGSHSCVLCAEYIPSTTAQELDRILAKSCDKSVAAAPRHSDLAAQLLGPAVAPVRILYREMALHCEQSGGTWLRSPRRRMALTKANLMFWNGMIDNLEAELHHA